MTKVAIVYHSGYGHTAKLAEAIAEGVTRGGAEVSLLKADDLTKPDEGPWDVLQEADAIIFGSPTYMGTATAVFQQFAEASSKIWFNQLWKDKLAAGFTISASASGDKAETLSRLATLASQHSMLWITPAVAKGYHAKGDDYDSAENRNGFYLGVGAFAPSDSAPEEFPHEPELETGRKLGERVAKAATRWMKGA
ncbi:flavodoxin family protein [Ponticaulis koreensis]|uniref:flavodoxin family protein n=1 Tax=Ponticaulis koreensis TaxID=1123045 RepID=UPI0003B7408E|nr:flavodoxin family protein [Ponticaulis koreensis]